MPVLSKEQGLNEYLLNERMNEWTDEHFHTQACQVSKSGIIIIDGGTEARRSYEGSLMSYNQWQNWDLYLLPFV